MEFIMATSKLKTQTTVGNKTSRKPTGWNVIEDWREDDTSNKWYLIKHWPQGDDEGKKRERVAASGQSRNPTTAESITGGGGVLCASIKTREMDECWGETIVERGITPLLTPTPPRADDRHHLSHPSERLAVKGCVGREVAGVLTMPQSAVSRNRRL